MKEKILGIVSKRKTSGNVSVLKRKRKKFLKTNIEMSIAERRKISTCLFQLKSKIHSEKCYRIIILKNKISGILIHLKLSGDFENSTQRKMLCYPTYIAMATYFEC